MGLTACVDESYDGNNTGGAQGGDGAISFNNLVAPIVRGMTTGKDAATMLGGKFYVYGIKNETVAGPGVLTSDNLVFQNYKVTYTDGTANSTTSNSAGWEYVGEQLTDNEAQHVQDNAGTGYQLIKYWDKQAKDYTFYAFAVGNDDIDKGNIKVTKTTNETLDAYRNGYKVTLTDQADPTKLYFSNRLYLSSTTDDATQSNHIGGQVKFSFRNAMAKVRVAMYETIPGYSLTIDAFRIADDNASPAFGDMTTEKNDAFAANLGHYTSGTAGNLEVTYDQDANSGDDAPVVSFSGTRNNVLTLGANLKKGTELKTTATDVVYDQTDGAYTSVYPMEDNGANLKLKVDFTLTSAVGEPITVKNATAEVPAAYLKWKPGYAYTYIFKISDQTNATIGSLTGLYPITFDAVAIADGTGKEEQISTMGEKVNIVTMGYDPATKLMTIAQDDYNEGNTLYASFIESNNLVTAQSTNAKLYIVTTNDAENYPVTEANVSGYLTAYAADQTLVDNPVTVYEQTLPADAFVSQVPEGDGSDDMRQLSAVSWTAGKHVYAVEYTAANGGTKYYKIIKVDGYNGRTSGTLSLDKDVVSNTGATITPSLTVDGFTPSNSEVTYTLDYAGTYGAAVPTTVTVNGSNIIVPENTAPTTGKKYTIIATYNRRTYKGTFAVNQ